MNCRGNFCHHGNFDGIKMVMEVVAVQVVMKDVMVATVDLH